MIWKRYLAIIHVLFILFHFIIKNFIANEAFFYIFSFLSYNLNLNLNLAFDLNLHYCLPCLFEEN